MPSPATAPPETPAPPGRRRLPRTLRVLWRGVMTVFVIVVVLLLAVTAAGQVAQWRLARAHPAPGELVDVGGHRLHVHRSGSGPAVVFDAGAGGTNPDWALVRDDVDQFATTVAYDRAGLGWSEPGPKPRTALRQVAELRTALQRSGVEPPYVLVGHSWGGLVMRAYTYEHPGEVAGLVLVDAAHEDQFTYYPPEYVDSARQMGRTMERLAWAFRAFFGSGIPALLNSRSADEVADALPPEARGRRRATGVMSGKHSRATIDEFSAIEESFAEVQRIRRPLGDLPVVVISHGLPVTEGVPEHLRPAVEEAWQKMQANLAGISTNASLRHAERSGHNIPMEQPEIIIEAVRDVLHGQP